MFQAAKDWLKRTWWGSIVAYAMLVAASYFAIWAVIEPLGVPDTVGPAPWPLNARWLYHIALALLIGSHTTIALDLYHRKQNWRDPLVPEQSAGSTKAGEIDLLPSRDQYLTTQIAAIESSKSRLVLFTSKMHRSEETDDARRVNAVMNSAARRGIHLRVLVARADSRLPGALELCRSGVAVVRFDPTLHLSDVNYLCVDESVAVVGERELQSDPAEYRSSRSWYHIQSTTLAASLMRQFDLRWSDYGTLTVEQMLRMGIPRDVKTYGVERVAKVLGLSVRATTSYSSGSPLIILLVGRPGSGKTTVAKALSTQLGAAGVVTPHISDLDFFRRMFGEDITPASGFVATSDGGYLVTDNDVWAQANDSLASAVAALPSGIQIAIVECARASYATLIAQLASRGVRPDFVAYINTSLDIAVKRNVFRRDFEGGHYVSQAEMEATYSKDDSEALGANLGDAAVVVHNELLGRDVEMIAAEIYERFREVLDRKAAPRRA